MHIYAGNLLMTTGSYEDATKTFTNADNLKRSPKALYQRARCYVALTNLKSSLQDLNKVLEINPSDRIVLLDRDVIDALHSVSAMNEYDESLILSKISVLGKLIASLTSEKEIDDLN
jgi:tetratricopeptide (TPR) repeat protein